jgi:hypothetical protein
MVFMLFEGIKFFKNKLCLPSLFYENVPKLPRLSIPFQSGKQHRRVWQDRPALGRVRGPRPHCPVADRPSGTMFMMDDTCGHFFSSKNLSNISNFIIIVQYRNYNRCQSYGFWIYNYLQRQRCSSFFIQRSTKNGLGYLLRWKFLQCWRCNSGS